MDYPKEWDKLPRKERRKKIKEFKKQNKEKKRHGKKLRNYLVALVVSGLVIAGVVFAMQKTPEQIAFEKKVKETTLEKVEEFPIEKADHVSKNTVVNYKTNPPTSGRHLAQAKNWGVYSKEIDDKAAVHGLEHGGIWITYKDVDEETISLLEDIGKKNPGSVIVSPRSANDVPIAVVSWGRMMKLDKADTLLIQKYIQK